MSRKSRLGWARDNTWLPTWLEGIAVIIAAIVAIVQLSQINRTLVSSAAANVFNQQLEVNRLFLEDDNYRLMPYFFGGEPIPPNVELQQKADQVAGSILDFFSSVEDQKNAGTFEVDEGWRAYIGESFRRSKVLCVTLKRDLSFYGGKDGYLWSNFGQAECSRWGVTA